jgi:hypothetical protein
MTKLMEEPAAMKTLTAAAKRTLDNRCFCFLQGWIARTNEFEENAAGEWCAQSSSHPQCAICPPVLSTEIVGRQWSEMKAFAREPWSGKNNPRDSAVGCK